MQHLSLIQPNWRKASLRSAIRMSNAG